MKGNRKKLISFIPRTIKIVDKSQDEILAERRRTRKEKLAKLLKRD
jgi:hypothetical protein